MREGKLSKLQPLGIVNVKEIKALCNEFIPSTMSQDEEPKSSVLTLKGSNKGSVAPRS